MDAHRAPRDNFFLEMHGKILKIKKKEKLQQGEFCLNTKK